MHIITAKLYRPHGSTCEQNDVACFYMPGLSEPEAWCVMATDGVYRGRGFFFLLYSKYPLC